MHLAAVFGQFRRDDLGGPLFLEADFRMAWMSRRICDNSSVKSSTSGISGMRVPRLTARSGVARVSQNTPLPKARRKGRAEEMKG